VQMERYESYRRSKIDKKSMRRVRNPRAAAAATTCCASCAAARHPTACFLKS